MKKSNASAGQIHEMLKTGWLPRSIRKKFPGTTAAKINHHRKLLGLPPFSSGGPRGPRNLAAFARARRLRNAGWTYEKIGAALGVSRQRAHQYVNKYKSGASNPR